jgi:hypothetical protein
MACCENSQVTVERLRNQIKNELPIGTSKSKVIDFLERKNIHHSDYSEIQEYETVQDVNGFKQVLTLHRTITADIRNVKNDVFTTYMIQIVFFFDENGNLEKYDVKRIGTSI